MGAMTYKCTTDWGTRQIDFLHWEWYWNLPSGTTIGGHTRTRRGAERALRVAVHGTAKLL